jgi:regulator of sigma E protease
MSVLIKAAYFIVLLGGLVFIHELGHFLAAKLFKVKVLKFSLGFGPRIWGFRRGETEYQLAALPLGGYVKMLGEDPTAEIPVEDRGRGFSEQSPSRRAFIAFAGPAFNLILPVIVFFALNLVPQPQDPPVVTIVLPDEAAEKAGLMPRDRVLSVDGVPTRSFEQMKEVIEERPGRTIAMVVERKGEQKTLQITPSTETEHSPIETLHKGKIGVMSGLLPPEVGVRPGSRAFVAGLRGFDSIAAVNGQKVKTILDLDDAIAAAGPQAALRLDVVRSSPVPLKTAGVNTSETLTINVPAGSEPLGLDRRDMYVWQVDPTSHAAAAGLQAFDKIVAIAGVPVRSMMRLGALIDGRKTIEMQVDRGGQLVNVTFDPIQIIRKNKMLGPMPETDYGFQLKPVVADEPPAADKVMISYTPAEAASRAVKQMGTMTRGMVLGIGAIFTGKVSHKSLGGPIMIGQLSSAASEQGLTSFFMLFALISINLGLMNLLPVPVLDGFHILLAGVEGISRRAVPVRVREAATWVGVVMLLALMALAFTNDIVRVLDL